MPENLPRFTQEEIASWAGLPYHELAFRVMRPFVEGSIADADFKKILEETYGEFAHAAVAPLRQLNSNEWVLELFHGPTLAFKDFALQLLGRLLDHVLAKRNERVVIIGATSGCLLYTSDAADDTPCVDLGGRRIPRRPCLLYTSPSPRDKRQSRMPSSA